MNIRKNVMSTVDITHSPFNKYNLVKEIYFLNNSVSEFTKDILK